VRVSGCDRIYSFGRNRCIETASGAMAELLSSERDETQAFLNGHGDGGNADDAPSHHHHPYHSCYGSGRGGGCGVREEDLSHPPGCSPREEAKGRSDRFVVDESLPLLMPHPPRVHPQGGGRRTASSGSEFHPDGRSGGWGGAASRLSFVSSAASSAVKMGRCGTTFSRIVSVTASFVVLVAVVVASSVSLLALQRVQRPPSSPPLLAWEVTTAAYAEAADSTPAGAGPASGVDAGIRAALLGFRPHNRQDEDGGSHLASTSAIRDIHDAEEHFVEVDDGIYVWFRTWGNPPTSDGGGVPVLFVHGGPGQAVADYDDGNRRFFDPVRTFVVEVDQRGTGSSRPSVRDDWRNMRLYRNITVSMIGDDYEVVRRHLGIDKWVVWGGSYGSTVGLSYAMRHPGSILALILRGVYLDTVKEMDEVYTRKAFADDPKKLSDFMRLYSYAADQASEDGRTPPGPNDSHGLVREYERMIVRGKKMAIWQWFAFENNLMEEDPRNLMDPDVIAEDRFAEAQSLGYFETRLWLHESWEDPSNLIARADRLTDIPTWICQGLRDHVRPPHNALHLVNAMKTSGRSAPLYGRFLESGHEDTDPVMEACLIQSMNEYLEAY
jgi:proline iminopeptidase